MTAVEWLIEQMKNGNFNSTYTKGRWNITYPAEMGSPLEIAKKMEKENIKEAYISACNRLMPYGYYGDSAEKYYNEKYNK